MREPGPIHLDVIDATDDCPISLDPTKPTWITCVGKKHSGKSSFNRSIFDAFPGDKFCVDVNGDASPNCEVERVEAPPGHFPARQDPNQARALYWLADPKSVTYRTELDDSLATALYPQDRTVMLWIGETGEFVKNGHCGPNMRLLMQQSRHYGLWVLMDAPRPLGLDTLVVSQADHMITYRLPNRRDRIFVAENIGVEPEEFEEAHRELIRAGQYHFLHYDSAGDKLYLRPPLHLPSPRVAQ